MSEISSKRKILLLSSLLFFTLFPSCNQSPSSAEDGKKETTIQLFQLKQPPETGLNFNLTGEKLLPGDNTGLTSNVSAVAVGDINNDGLPDLFFSGGVAPSALYLNGGDFKFRDITHSSGIMDHAEGMADNEGVNFVDINGDGYLDIYILKTGITGNFSRQQFTDHGANLLYINQGDNTFVEQASKYGLNLIGLSHTANFFDYDGDGDLDVYMVYTGEPGAAFSFPYYEAPPRSRWLNDQFLENTGDRFVDVREKAGLPYVRNIGLSVAVGDVNNDGFSDIYVANDFFGPDFFYLNNGDKTFREARSEYFTKTPMSAMGSDFADINNDGWLDLFVGEMMPESHRRQKVNLVPFSIEIYNKLRDQGNPQYTRNMLQLNKGGKRFRDIGLLAGVHATEWSWSSFFFDADNDGLKDLYVANGILRDMTNMDYVKSNFGEDYTTMADPQAKAKANPAEAPVIKNQNVIYRNNGDYDFQKMNAAWGMDQAVHTRGATYADLDGDGDLDVILNNMTEGPVIYENRAEELPEQHYLRLRLRAKGRNTFGIGARADLYYQGRFQTGYLSNQRGFQSSPEPILHFGLGSSSRVDSLVLTWPGGEKEVFRNISADQVMEIQQGSGAPVSKEPAAIAAPLFQATGETIDFVHRENPFYDYLMERLLIRQYSQEGPGIAVADVNGDGLDDCFIGGAARMEGKLFLQTAEGGFREASTQPWAGQPYAEEMGAVFFDANSDGAPDLYLASGTYEVSAQAPVLADRLFINDGGGNFREASQVLPDGVAYSSAVTAGDYDRDGDLDLFVGARVTPGNYSEIPPSRLLRNDMGRFTDVITEVAPGLQRAGRISSALWTDADNDGDLDLVLAGEWMPFTIFYQDGGTFQKQEIEGSEGWWNSVTGADVDNDGDMDYIAGNHGLNSIFKASAEQPVTLVVSDFDGNGKKDPLVFKYTDGVNAPFANRDIFTSQMPSFNNQYYSFEKYAGATYEELVKEEVRKKAAISYARELRSSVFLNQGGGQFEVIPLPVEAQFAPAYGMIAEDFNGDGNLDLLLCGNTYANHYEYGSIDALGGLLLLGKGDGSFQPKTEDASGFDLPYNPKSMVWLHHQSGKPWIIVGNNNSPLQTYALRDKVEVVPVPSDATHALIELADGSTRRWEFYYGGGYLSQSSRHVLKTRPVQNVTFFRQEEAVE